jgi:hypothetical protein
MSNHIAYHVMLRALHGEEEIDLKNDRLVKHISKILKEKNCHEYCLGARYDQVNMLFSLDPGIALNDLLDPICSTTDTLIRNDLKIDHFNGWNKDHIIFTHSTNFMRHIIDFIKADDEEYQEERMAREAEFYDRAKRGWLFDDLDPEFDDLILLDAER